MDADEAQARVQLAAHLYRQTVLATTRALLDRGEGPITAEDKMRLHALVEPAAWALPADLFEGDGSDEWLERTLESPRVERFVREMVDAFLRERASS